jgi:hypothetical protein
MRQREESCIRVHHDALHHPILRRESDHLG